MKKIVSVLFLNLLFSFSTFADSTVTEVADSEISLPAACIVEDCEGGTWQQKAIHWRIRKTDDNTILEYGPGASWNDDTRRDATLKICNRHYLGGVCTSCQVRGFPYQMPECKP